MNRVKKLLILTMAMALSCLLLTACSSSSSSEKKESAPAKDQTTVSVVSKSTEKVPGMNSPVVTEYEYDADGRLVSSSKTGDSSYNNNKTTYKYDDKGDLVSTSTTFEQYGWAEGNKESFEYDSNHNCVKYHYEITFEGDGSTDATYTYDANGQIQTSEVKTYFDNEPIDSYKYEYAYMADGIIKSVSSSSADAPTFAVNELFSDMLKGVFTYDDSFNNRTVLAFDDTGLLKTIESASQAGQSKTEFEYTQIEVKTADYRPTIYSNPQGFSSSVLPSISEAIKITLVK